MAAMEKAEHEYCDSSSESELDEQCELILGRYIVPQKASSLLKTAKDRKIMRLRCLKHHKRKQMPNDSFSEYSKISKDGSSSSKVCMEDDHEASDTISEVKSTSSMGTSVHLGTVSKSNLTVFDFPDESPNNLVFPALMGNHVKTHHARTVHPTNSRPPRRKDRMTSLLSTMIEQGKMDREISHHPLSPDSREHKEEVSTNLTLISSDNADSDVHRNGNTSDVALTAPLPFLNPTTVVSKNSHTKLSVCDVSFGLDSEPNSPNEFGSLKQGLLSQISSVEQFLADDSLT